MPHYLVRLLAEGATLGLMLLAWDRCPECFDRSLATLLVPPSLSLILAGGILLGARILLGWMLDLLLPAYRDYVDRVHYPAMRRQLRARGIPLLLWIIIAGAVEELAYRGLLLPVFGLLPTSLFFGLSHLFPALKGERREWPHALGTFCSALLYGGGVLITGSLWPAVLAHATGNGVLGLQLLRQGRQIHPGRAQEGSRFSPNPHS